MSSQRSLLWIDAQTADARVDFYAENNVPPEELLGGQLTAAQLPLIEEVQMPATNPFHFHGDNWPYAEPYDMQVDWLRVDTVRDETNKIIKRTRISAERYSLFWYALGNEWDISLDGKNIPLHLKGANSLTLAAADVGIQGPLEKDVTIKMCPESKCKLTVGRIPAGEEFATVSGTGLTVVAKVCDWHPKIPETVTFLCDTINLQSGRDVNGLTLNENGVVKVVYGYPTEANISDVTALWEEKTKDHQWFADTESANLSSSLWDDWNFVLQFASENKDSLSKALTGQAVNSFTKVLEDLTYHGHANIEVARNDLVPLAFLYSKNPQTIVCMKEGDAKVSDWSIAFGNELEPWNGKYLTFGQYGPSLSEISVSGGSLAVMDDNKKCIGFKFDHPPNSAFVAVVYTSNETYIDILNAFTGFVTLVTPDNIGTQVSLANPQAKNVLVIFLDSIEGKKSLDLRGARTDSNIFVFGIPSKSLDNVFQILEKAYDANPDDDQEIQKLIDPLITSYADYFPSVSLITNHLSTLFLAGVNYLGQKIDCEQFYAVGCSFSSAEGLSVNAQYTCTETYTYNSLKSVALNDLLIFPVSTSPVDHISISSVEYTETKVTFKGTSGYSNVLGEQTAEYSYDVPIDKVMGQLYLLSFTDALTFAIPNDQTVKKVKGVSAIMGADFNNFALTSFFPKSPLLAGDDVDSIAIRVVNALLKRAKTLATSKTVTFTGNWEAVEEVDGIFGVDTADTAVSLTGVPVKVVETLQVKSSVTAQIKLPEGVTEVQMKDQLVTGPQTVSFADTLRVTFTNITFTGGIASKIQESSFNLVIGAKDHQVVTNHLKCSDYSRASMSSVLIEESLEMGVGSSLSATTLAANDVIMTLHYLLDSGFPTFTQSANFDVKRLDLVYDGVSVTNLDEYANRMFTVVNLDSAERCQRWKSSATFTGENLGVYLACNDATLVMKFGAPPESPNDLPIGAIVGGVIGCLVVIAIVVVIIVVLRKKRIQKDTTESKDGSTVDSTEQETA